MKKLHKSFLVHPDSSSQRPFDIRVPLHYFRIIPLFVIYNSFRLQNTSLLFLIHSYPFYISPACFRVHLHYRSTLIILVCNPIQFYVTSTLFVVHSYSSSIRPLDFRISLNYFLHSYSSQLFWLQFISLLFAVQLYSSSVKPIDFRVPLHYLLFSYIRHFKGPLILGYLFIISSPLIFVISKVF